MSECLFDNKTIRLCAFVAMYGKCLVRMVLSFGSPFRLMHNNCVYVYGVSIIRKVNKYTNLLNKF